MIDLTRVYKRIDTDIPRHIKQIQGFISQPTISNTGEGMTEGAEYLKEVYEKLGCQIAEIRETPGWPVVYGEYDAGAEKTLIICARACTTACQQMSLGGAYPPSRRSLFTTIKWAHTNHSKPC